MNEVWLTGPVDGVPPLLMPAAHAFLQVKQDMPALLDQLSADTLWQAHGRSASIGFHALHLAGATDRLLTYARGEPLSDAQLAEARRERHETGLDVEGVLARVNAAMDAAVGYLRTLGDADLLAPRAVGRQQLPSTVLGLIFHAAEHATRHAGQIVTLRRISIP